MTTRSQTAHIAIYLHTLYNGGVERVMFNLIQGFLSRGIAVDLVLDFLIYSPFEKLIPEGTRVVKLEAYGARKRLTGLVGYLRRERPEALLSATHFANEIACVAKRLAGVTTKVFVSEHTNLSADIIDSPGRARRALLPLTTRMIYLLADGIVAVSNGVAADMCRVSGLNPARVQTIYNPIDFEGLAANAAEPLDEPWFSGDLLDRPPVILAIGRLETQKNFPNLLRAFAAVRKTKPVRLLILGEGSERERLTAMVEEMGLAGDVSLPGFVANPAAYMARSAVFAMSSSWEGMPVALIEALTLGVPVVSTNCPSGPAEILANGAYGELVAMDDSPALAAAILRALDGHTKTAPPEWLAQFESRTITDRYVALMLG